MDSPTKAGSRRSTYNTSTHLVHSTNCRNSWVILVLLQFKYTQYGWTTTMCQTLCLILGDQGQTRCGISHERNGHISRLFQYHVVCVVIEVNMGYLAHLSHRKASWWLTNFFYGFWISHPVGEMKVERVVQAGKASQLKVQRHGSTWWMLGTIPSMNNKEGSGKGFGWQVSKTADVKGSKLAQEFRQYCMVMRSCQI